MTPFEIWLKENWDLKSFGDDADSMRDWLKEAYEAGYKEAIREDGELWRELLER
jgi:hypothetical protein